MDQPALWTRRRLLGAIGAGALTTIGVAGSARAIGGRTSRPAVQLLPGKRAALDPAPSPPMPEAGLPAEAVPGTGRPPQFIVVSFDGSASNQLLTYWRTLGRQTNARFSFFVSGTYLLLRERAGLYHPPRHGDGKSDIGFFPVPAGADPAAELGGLLRQFGEAHQEGHEIGTHYNGHFCGRSLRSVGFWDAADWRSELEQFRSLLAKVAANNGLAPVDLPFTPADVVGGRTPCLEGDLSVLYPTLAAAGFRYDASDNGPEGAWPVRRHGLWSMPLHAIVLSGTQRRVLALDYNLYANQTGAKPAAPQRIPAIRAQALQTFRDYFVASYSGNRAPMAIGNHFARWNSSAYIDALSDFLTEVAAIPEVHFVTYRTLVDWLDARTPLELAAFSAGRFPKRPVGMSHADHVA